MNRQILKSLSSHWFVVSGALVWLIGIACWFGLLPWAALACALTAVVITVLVMGYRPGPVVIYERLVNRCASLQFLLDHTLKPALDDAQFALGSYTKALERTDLPEDIREKLVSIEAATAKQVTFLSGEVLLSETELALAQEKLAASREKLLALVLERANYRLKMARMEACLF